ncbi:transcription antitermination factor NusB, partial [Treponema pallidum]
VSSRLEHWDFVRLNKVDKAILRLSAYSLLFQKDIPPVVVIHEAVSIARDFGTDDSFRFVNGVLDNIAKSA